MRGYTGFPDYARIQSPIVKLHWAGWEASTLSLQQAGWQISAEELMESWQVRLALKHPQLKMYGITSSIDAQALHNERMMSMRGPDMAMLHVNHMATSLMLNIIETRGYENFKPIDAEPFFTRDAPRSIEDYRIFRAIRQPEQQIVVAPQSVPELLEQILKMQDPKQKEIREKRNREIRQFMREAMNIDAGKSDERIAAEILVGV